MASENLDRVLEGVQSLTAAERRELRARLDTWSKPVRSGEDELDQRLLNAGVITDVPAERTDVALYRRWKPITVKGKPLSETIMEERR
jgi:hypothetical protein